MALVKILEFQSQYENSEVEYNQLMKNTKWLDPSTDEGVRAQTLNEEMEIILRNLVLELKNYKHSSSTDTYNQLLTKYQTLESKRVKPKYQQEIEDNKILIHMNQFYVFLWTCVVVALSLFVLMG